MNLEHGTANRYNIGRCRCTECRQAIYDLKVARTAPKSPRGINDLNGREHFLYRLFDWSGDLLYVGLTTERRPERRIGRHRNRQPWGSAIARFTVEPVGTNRCAALDAERAAIKSEWPKHNVVVPLLPSQTAPTTTPTAFPTPLAVADRDRGPFVDAFLHELADDPRLDAIVAWAMAGGAK